MNKKWGINAGIFLTKEEFLIAADLAEGQSISEYLSQIIRKHLNQPPNTRTQPGDAIEITKMEAPTGGPK